MNYRDYLDTAHWDHVRREAYARASYRCSRCGRKRRLSAHHRTYERLGQERPGDIEVLCGWCHFWQHPWRTLRGLIWKTVPIIVAATLLLCVLAGLLIGHWGPAGWILLLGALLVAWVAWRRGHGKG